MAVKLDKPQPVSPAVMAFPQAPLRNSEEYLKAYSGYAYTAISSIAQEVASIDLHLFRNKFTRTGPETTEIYEHESLSVLNYANELTTFYDLLESTQIYLELTGEAFWIILKQGNTPRELWLIRPDWVKVIPSKDKIIDHYIYCPGGNINQGVDIPKDNMIQFKYFHPMNPYRGKGSVQAAALPLDIHTFAQEYNRNFFFNSAIPSLVFTTDQKLQDTTIKRFINQWQATYGGRAKSNKIAFLGGGLKIDKVSVGGKEMDFTEQQRMMRDDILAVFKVPKTILGLTDDVNRANAEATTIAFMERVVTPRMKKIVNALNEFYIPMFGESNLFFDFTDPAPEDTTQKLLYYDNALKNGWMTPNEVRVEENMEPIPGGDVPIIYILNSFAPKPQEFLDEYPEPTTSPTNPASVSPSQEAQGSISPSQEPTPNKGIFDIFKRVFNKKELEQVIVPQTKSSVSPTFPPAKKKAFKHMIKPPVKRLEVIQREKLTEKLVGPVTEFIGDLLKNKDVDNVGMEKGKKKTESIKKITLFTNEEKLSYWKQFIKHTDDWNMKIRNATIDVFKEQEHMVMDLLNSSVKYWRKDLRKGKESSAIPTPAQMHVLWQSAWLELLKEVYIGQGDYVLDFLGVGGHLDLTTKTAQLYLKNYSSQLITMIDDTTREKIKLVLAEGFGAGESIDDLSKRVEGVFETATTSRADMIARTESIRAANSATVEAYRQSDVVEAKEWLTEMDNRTCPVCESLDGKTIDLDGNFFNEGDTVTVGETQVSVGGVDVPEPPLHPDCRCTTIPVIIER